MTRAASFNPGKAIMGGVLAGGGPVTGEVARTEKGFSEGRQERADAIVVQQLPEYEQVAFGFDFNGTGDGISVPNGLSAANNPAWWKFCSVNPNVDGIQRGYFGVALEMLPADTGNGDTAIGLNQPWGSQDGRGAYIVIGSNLPGVIGTWSMIGTNFLGRGLGLDQNGGGPSPIIWEVIGFPPGDFRDRRATLRTVTRFSSPFVRRIAQGRTLDAALVIPGLANASGAARNLCGTASGMLYTAPVFPTANLRVQ